MRGKVEQHLTVRKYFASDSLVHPSTEAFGSIRETEAAVGECPVGEENDWQFVLGSVRAPSIFKSSRTWMP